MIQFTTEGVEINGTDEELHAARKTFARDKLLRIPQFFSPELAEAVRKGSRDGRVRVDPTADDPQVGIRRPVCECAHDLKSGVRLSTC